MKLGVALTALLVVSAPTRTLAAQGTHRLGVEAARVAVASKDYLASPLLYEGSGVLIASTYDYAGPSNHHEVRLSLTLPSLTHGAGRAAASVDATSMVADYRYVRKVGALCGGEVFLGMSGGLDATLRDYSHGGTYWEGYLQAGPAVVYGRPISSRARLRVSAASPLIAWAMRPPSSIDSDELYRAYYENSRFVTSLGRWAGPLDLQSATLQVQYIYRILRRLEAGVAYRHMSRRYTAPRSTKTGHSGLHLSLWVML